MACQTEASIIISVAGFPALYCVGPAHAVALGETLNLETFAAALSMLALKALDILAAMQDANSACCPRREGRDASKGLSKLSLRVYRDEAWEFCDNDLQGAHTYTRCLKQCRSLNFAYILVLDSLQKYKVWKLLRMDFTMILRTIQALHCPKPCFRAWPQRASG